MMVAEVVKNSKLNAPHPITILSTVEISGDFLEEFEELMQMLSVKSRKENGIIRFDVLQDAES